MIRTTHKVIGKQQGAALVIGLVLLVVLLTLNASAIILRQRFRRRLSA